MSTVTTYAKADTGAPMAMAAMAAVVAVAATSDAVADSRTGTITATTGDAVGTTAVAAAAL